MSMNQRKQKNEWKGDESCGERKEKRRTTCRMIRNGTSSTSQLEQINDK